MRLLLASGSVDTHCRIDGRRRRPPQVVRPDRTRRERRRCRCARSPSVPDIPVVHISALSTESRRPSLARSCRRAGLVGGGRGAARPPIPAGRARHDRGRRGDRCDGALLGMEPVIPAGRSGAPTSGDDSTGAAAPRAAPSTPIVERRVLGAPREAEHRADCVQQIGRTARARRRTGGRAADSRPRARASRTRHAVPRVDPLAGSPAGLRRAVRRNRGCGVPRRVRVPRASRLQSRPKPPVTGRPAHYRVSATRE